MTWAEEKEEEEGGGRVYIGAAREAVVFDTRGGKQ